MPRAAASTSARAASTAGLVALGPHPLDPVHLRPLQLGVDGEHLGGLELLVDELVDADHDLLVGVDRLGEGVGGLLDLLLHVLGLDGVHRPAHGVDPLEVLPGVPLHLVGQRLDEPRAGQRVDGVGDARLVADDLLGPQGDLGGPLGGQAEGLVEAVGVEALGAARGRRPGPGR